MASDGRLHPASTTTNKNTAHVGDPGSSPFAPCKEKGRSMSASGWIAGLSALVLMGGSAEAGRLEPPGPPAPTMKSLDEIPSWSQALPANDTGDPCNSSRFKCVLQTVAQLEGAAVLDRETGLVWERTPDTTKRTWFNAVSYCYSKSVGNRKGWRLPTIEELESLMDPSVPYPGPTLPSGHPFAIVSSPNYWSSTTFASPLFTTGAWFMALEGGESYDLKDNANIDVWCVRGGHGHDGRQ
jgi:hypothetical protein